MFLLQQFHFFQHCSVAGTSATLAVLIFYCQRRSPITPPPRGQERNVQDEIWKMSVQLLSFYVPLKVCLSLRPPSPPPRGTRGWRCCTRGVWLRWAALLPRAPLVVLVHLQPWAAVCLCVSVCGVCRTAQFHSQSGDCFLLACLRCSWPGLSGSGVGVGSQLQVIKPESVLTTEL